MKRPNILFLLTDQQRADSLGCYGNSAVSTPNIDRLAAEGVLFHNAHCTHPLCMPSRATLMTGRYPSAHGVYRNGIPLDPRETGFAPVLRDSGYRTALIGKGHLTPSTGDPDRFPEAMRLTNGLDAERCWAFWREYRGPFYGFDHVEMTLGHGDTGIQGGHYGLWLHENHPGHVSDFSSDAAVRTPLPQFQTWGSAVPQEIHPTNWIADRAIDFLKQQREEPFCAWVSFPEPHPPFIPPQPYCDMYPEDRVPLSAGSPEDWGDSSPDHVRHYLHRGSWDTITEDQARAVVARYYGLVSLVDSAVGRVLKAVQDLGLAEDTVILFASDHGDWMGDHGLWLKGAVHTRGVTRIPLIARWPGVTVPGREVTGPASLVDLMPTILDVAGIEAPYGVQGRSLRPVLSGATEQLRPYALIEHRHEPQHINLRFEKKARVINKTDREWRMKSIVTDRYRLSYVPTEGYGELFDIVADPDERNDLWDRQPTLRQELLLQMLDALIEAEDPLPERIWRV